MAQKDGDFLAGEELDDLYLLLDFGEDVNFNVEIDDVVSVVGVSNEKCEQCEKVCKSKRDLARHIDVKHVVVDNTSGSSGLIGFFNVLPMCWYCF